MNTIAQHLAALPFAAATNEADRIAVSTNQDWENETTTFVFEDGSSIRACYPTVEVVKAEA